MFFENLTKEEKIKLYNSSKDAYYNGNSELTDIEFDELEKDLGLENMGYVGTHHQKNYTVHHPFLMGSLSKVQVKEDDEHMINWFDLQENVLSYLRKSKCFMKDGWYFEVTPKYDGCSWEAVINPKGELVSVSTRGDGEFGKDIKVWFKEEWKKNYEPYVLEYYKSIDQQSYTFLKYLVVRGECLINKTIFNEKYSIEFTMPRSFVAGCLGQDWEGTDKQKEIRSDLSWIAYDFREVYGNGIIVELDYSGTSGHNVNQNIGIKPNKIYVGKNFDLKPIYEEFEGYRENCEFALDGFVVKPCAMFRIQDNERTRQEDCVAVKFLPEIVETELINIEWNVGKTGEYYPTGILKPVVLGGKIVERVSLANYGKIKDEHIGICSVLKISLAGDIIPFVYDVLSKSNKIEYPTDSYVDGVHLMKTLSNEEKQYIKFINSVNVLKPDGIGEKVADRLYNIKQVGNILDMMSDIPYIQEQLDESKSSQNIISALEERKKTLSLQDVIQSMGYDNCGEKNAFWLAKKISGIDVDTKGIPSTIIGLSNNDAFIQKVESYIVSFNIPLISAENNYDKIPVILTGSPKDAGYSTKGEFLLKNPKYIETSKWNECKILFTDDIYSNSSKMLKAKKCNILIKTYFDA